jgi:ESX-1-secreted protein regulator
VARPGVRKVLWRMALFTERFNYLREKMTPPGRGKLLTAAEIAAGVEQATGTRISPQAIAYYITGERQPSLALAAALAKFFGVPTSYWTDDNVSEVDKDVEKFQAIKALKEAKVQRVAARLGEFAATLDDFSTAELEMLDAILDRIRPTGT